MSSKWKITTIGLCVIILIGVGLFFGLRDKSDEQPEQAADESVVTPSPSPSPDPSEIEEEPEEVEVKVDATLTVKADQFVSSMSDLVRGTNIGLWTIGEFHPFEKRSERYMNLVKEAGISLIRFPAGSEADTIYWDRDNSYVWYQGPEPYIKTLTTDMFDSYMAFLDEIGAEALVTVNARINNPEMAADMVRYANIEKGHNIKYWEIGNEPEYYGDEYAVTPEEFAMRIIEYAEAMRAVDPTIKIVGPAAGGITGLMTSMVKPVLSKLHEEGKPVDAISVHYYPLAGNQDNPASTAFPSIENLLRYKGGNWPPSVINWVDLVTEGTPNDNLVNYRDTYAPGALIGITELGQVTDLGEGIADSHAGAIWLADVLGRFAYHHVDFINQFLLQGNQTYSLMNMEKQIRPSYYVYPMLKRYFGNELVETKSSNDQNFTIWASKRAGADDTLYVMVINKHQTNDLVAAIELSDFNPKSTAKMWVMNAPAVDSLTGTNINGVEVAEDGSLADIPGEPITGLSNKIIRTFPAHSVTIIELSAE